MNPEEEAIKEMIAMNDQEILMVPFDTVKWICQAKGCNRHTKLRDYGISPIYYHPKMKGRWQDLTKTFFLCSKHWKFHERLKKSFNLYHIGRKIIDYTKQNIIKL